MLHMLVNTHNAESCAFRSPADEAALAPAFALLGEVAQQRGATLHGSWVNTGSHTIFALVDAPNAHVVDEVVREAGLTGRTNTQVFAVDDTQAVFADEGQGPMTTTAGQVAWRSGSVGTHDRALVEAFYAALDDVPALLRLCAADAEFRYPGEGRLAYGGRWQGHDQIVRFLEAHDDEEEILDFAVREVLGREGRLVALGNFRGRAKPTGRIWETNFVHAISAQAGRVQRFEAYFDTAAAVEAHRG